MYPHELDLLGRLWFPVARSEDVAGSPVDAELLGIVSRTGTLEAGKLADVVACPGNPEENVRQVEKVFFVMKEGVVYKNQKPDVRTQKSE